MWGYTTNTTDGKTVYVYFGERTGDTQTYIFNNFVKWDKQTTITWGPHTEK